MKTILVITLSFIIALVLEMIPLPWAANWVRPEWVLLVLIYWVMILPDKVGVNVAFILGLFMDLSKGTLLGSHALAFVIIAYFIARFYSRLKLPSIWQQLFLVLIFVFAFQTFEFWVWGLSGVVRGVGDGRYWLATISSVLVWPLVYVGLRVYQNYYKVY